MSSRNSYPADQARLDRHKKMLDWRHEGQFVVSFVPRKLDPFGDYHARVELYGQVFWCPLDDYPTEEMFAHVALAVQANGG